MTNLCCKVLETLREKTLVSAESCTGGWIGKELTSIPGSSEVYKGGIICYTNFVKQQILGVNPDTLFKYGAVSKETAGEMAKGARRILEADVAVSVTGLAGPGGDEFGNEVGTVFIGCETQHTSAVREFHFDGDRDSVRKQAVQAALELILDMQKEPTV